MFILLGAVFLAYQGTSALSGLYEENGALDLSYAAEQWANSLARSIPDALVLAVALVAALGLAAAAYVRRRRKPHNIPGNDNYDSFEESRERRHPDRANR